MQDVVDTLTKLSRRTLKLLAKIAKRSGVAVTHGDQMVVTSEDRGLAVAYAVPNQLGRLSDDVKLAVIDFELRRAHRMHRVINRQWMQIVGRLKRPEFAFRRLAEPNPAEARSVLVELNPLVDSDFADAATLVVIVSGDDAHAGLAGMTRPRCTAGRARPRSNQPRTFRCSAMRNRSPAS